uniref:Uncharacterized protein n=1 Tax=Anguilla anguilla TaxID=7936 RepID=A0A0E9WNF9_ANGAN
MALEWCYAYILGYCYVTFLFCIYVHLVFKKQVSTITVFSRKTCPRMCGICVYLYLLYSVALNR